MKGSQPQPVLAHKRKEGLPFSFSVKRALMEDCQLLCEASRNGDLDKVTALINSGTDVSYFDTDGFTPLMHAAKLGHAAVVKALLEAGAPWNALSPSHISAGDLAMEEGHQETFEILLNAGMPIANYSLAFIQQLIAI